jgi:hypothetical protein
MVVTGPDPIARPSCHTTLRAGAPIPQDPPAGVGFPRQPRVRFAAPDRVSIEIEGSCIPTNPVELA